MKKKKKAERLKKKKEIRREKIIFRVIIIFIIIICLFGLSYSIYNIINWKKDSSQIDKKIKEIEDIVEVEEVEEDENTEIIEQVEEVPEFNPYWDYIKLGLINVDFEELKIINPDVVGWIQVGGTNINNPFVQGVDNKFYLNHSFDKSDNQLGWAFLDYRNNKNEYEKNNIIYGHALKNGALFGSLKNILNENWFTNTNNRIVKLSTPTENTLWQIFSVYVIDTTTDYLQINFDTKEEFLDFSNILIKRSEYDFETKVLENDKILTLSTCYITSDQKLVLHAKLIKRESK